MKRFLWDEVRERSAVFSMRRTRLMKSLNRELSREQCKDGTPYPDEGGMLGLNEVEKKRGRNWTPSLKGSDDSAILDSVGAFPVEPHFVHQRSDNCFEN